MNKLYVVYDPTNNNQLVHMPSGKNSTKLYYPPERGAKIALSRLRTRISAQVIAGKNPKFLIKPDFFEITDLDTYNEKYGNKKVERVNFMTGETYMEDVNTPLCCSPSSETYWSM